METAIAALKVLMAETTKMMADLEEGSLSHSYLKGKLSGYEYGARLIQDEIDHQQRINDILLGELYTQINK